MTPGYIAGDVSRLHQKVFMIPTIRHTYLLMFTAPTQCFSQLLTIAFAFHGHFKCVTESHYQLIKSSLKKLLC